MKILRITLQNIASLAGLHTVDFTKEPLRAAGLYAISGDTGSGKSSLLDAMCLALYGKTPRLKDGRDSLERINNDEKQLDPRSLLRRGTATGMAEVAFVGVDEQEWTARWSVRRARKSVSGKLQNVERTLFKGHIEPAGEGEIAVGGKKTEVGPAIEERLGLTFDQFIRAVLLAQNEFAVFLQSTDKDRAEILQALTGTGRFEEISRAVFERSREEKQRLEVMRAGLQGATVLTEEERSEKAAELQTAQQQLQQLQAEFKQLETEQKWHLDLATHDATMKAAEEALKQTQQTVTENAGRRQMLECTQQALRQAWPLQSAVDEAAALVKKYGDHAKATAVEQQQQQSQTEASAKELSAAKTACEEAKKAVEELQPKLQEAASLQGTLTQQQEAVQAAKSDLEAATSAHDQAQQRLTETKTKLQTAQTEHEKLKATHQALAAYEPFAAEQSLWIDRLTAAVGTKQQLQSATTSMKQLQASHQKLISERDQAKSNWEQVQRKQTTALAELRAAEQQVQNFDRAESNRQRDALQSRRDQWTSFRTYVLEVVECERDLKECSRKLVETKSGIAQRQTQLRLLVETELPKTEQELAERQASLTAVQSAISDEAIRLRTTLQEDEHCPVCGSTNHPFSLQPPTADQTAVAVLKQRVTEAQQSATACLQKKSTLETELRNQESQQSQLTEEQARLESERNQLCFDFSLSEFTDLKSQPSPEQQQAAETTLESIERELEVLKAKEQQALKAEEQETKCRTLAEQLQRETAGAKETLSEHEQKLSVCEAERSQQQKRVAELETQQQNQLLPLQELFVSLPEGQLKFEADSSNFVNNFSEAVQQVREVGQTGDRLQSEMAQLSDRLTTFQPVAETSAARKYEAGQKYEQSVQVQAATEQRLSELFDGATADEAKSNSAKQLAAADSKVAECQENHRQAEQSLKTLADRLSFQQQQLQEAEQKATESAAAFASWRQSFEERHERSFSDDDLKLMLSRDENWLTTEEAVLDTLEAAVQEKTGELATLKTQREQLLQRRVSEKTAAEVAEQFEATSEKVVEAEKAKEAVAAILTVDDNDRKKSEQLRKDIAMQEKAVEPWLKLNDVIGSSDGAAFRNIAQRYTLDILLTFANHQLTLLSGRYRLKRVPGSLNLTVIDQDMADEERSVHSLSGGESFLVSLALALGLASLTANRLKIESLFIDEGFGSLDPNTLDLAMNALVQLESQGRKVGVISHITTMTDAIPVQIKVTKGSSGASTIHVPEAVNILPPKVASVAVPRVQGTLFGEE